MTNQLSSSQENQSSRGGDVYYVRRWQVQNARQSVEFVTNIDGPTSDNTAPANTEVHITRAQQQELETKAYQFTPGENSDSTPLQPPAGDNANNTVNATVEYYRQQIDDIHNGKEA
jgi:hypothetical protein